MYTVIALDFAAFDMAKAYSDDLRCKLLTAYDRGQGSLRELAELFSVSYDRAKKISRQRLRSQQMERVAQGRHGVASRVTPEVEAELLRQLREQPDCTLADLQKGLQKSLRIGSKYPPAEPVALRLLAPQRGLIATVEKQKQKQKQKPDQFNACDGIDRSRDKDRLP